MEKEMIKIMTVCDNKEYLNELTGAINRRGAEIAAAIGRPGVEVAVVSFAKTSDLNGTTKRNIENLEAIVLSSAGKADPPYDLWLFQRKFPRASKISESDSPERDYYMKCCWGADDIFRKGEDIVDVIIRALKVKKLVSQLGKDG